MLYTRITPSCIPALDVSIDQLIVAITGKKFTLTVLGASITASLNVVPGPGPYRVLPPRDGVDGVDDHELVGSALVSQLASVGVAVKVAVAPWFIQCPPCGCMLSPIRLPSDTAVVARVPLDAAEVTLVCTRCW